jgi:hypothetical protein
MQFRLMTLLILLTALALGGAMVLTAPAGVSLLVMAIMLWISPSFWIAGAVYARRSPQAFFVGGIAAGAIPYLIATQYSSSLFVLPLLQLWSTGGTVRLTNLFNTGANVNVIVVGIAFLVPTLLSVGGGAIGVLVRWITLPGMTTDKPAAVIKRPRVLHPLDVEAADDSVLLILPPGLPDEPPLPTVRSVP